ncbi:uncharacterized protein MYCFIDRAFT_174830 [Pseudocercospora fijiensis CIRAD86]|uniref:Uncharacterized protein n=1 Tax=Pseudocercospora fijiensis (strain CIRAD86) TaxID=383855 RepID=M3AFK9_PSEFD|nr:uncharacterized protein MYCFIDRAFT_174830 [Pseudocercospora fijiensis CIRAD86]EME83381.1 hypothetical protein MYCFIDRAFT_174830 [Pseudocercospora fijiensis CIRAD86]
MNQHIQIVNKKDSEQENAALKKQIEDLESRFKTRNTKPQPFACLKLDVKAEVKGLADKIAELEYQEEEYQDDEVIAPENVSRLSRGETRV